MVFGITLFILAFGVSVASAFPAIHNNLSLTSVFALVAFLIFYGTIFKVLAVIFFDDKGGVPLLKPKDYVNESLIFCPVNRAGDFWLATFHNFNGSTIAISSLDFAPKDRKLIQDILEKSIEEEKRPIITAYGCGVGKGYIFALGENDSSEDEEASAQEQN